MSICAWPVLSCCVKANLSERESDLDCDSVCKHILVMWNDELLFLLQLIDMIKQKILYFFLPLLLPNASTFRQICHCRQLFTLPYFLVTLVCSWVLKPVINLKLELNFGMNLSHPFCSPNILCLLAKSNKILRHIKFHCVQPSLRCSPACNESCHLLGFICNYNMSLKE